MITELEIEGFKSFGSPGVKLTLEPINFIVGANASGKTNILLALEFLKNIVERDLEFAIDEMGGWQEVFNSQAKEKIIALKLKSHGNFYLKQFPELSVNDYDYSLSIAIDSENKPYIKTEKLIVTYNDVIKVEFIRKGKDVYFNKGKQKNPFGTYPESELSSMSIGHFHVKNSIISFPGNEMVSNLLHDISLWSFYNLIPDEIRKPSRYLNGKNFLEKKGSNLSSLLYYLNENRPDFLTAIIYTLKGVIPGFENIQPEKEPYSSHWAFKVIEDKIENGIQPSSVSDGTLRMIALMVVTTWVSQISSLICIEEPENGVHPDLYKHIIDCIRGALELSNTQFLITTHNAEFLDYLQPNEVILCDKVDGNTRIKRASDETDIDEFLKSFSLGELWEQGTLGGVV